MQAQRCIYEAEVLAGLLDRHETEAVQPPPVRRARDHAEAVRIHRSEASMRRGVQTCRQADRRGLQASRGVGALQHVTCCRRLPRVCPSLEWRAAEDPGGVKSHGTGVDQQLELEAEVHELPEVPPDMVEPAVMP